MKTKEQQGFRRLGRRTFGLQVVMLVLVMLSGGSTTAWAEQSWEGTATDPGGGTYTYEIHRWYLDKQEPANYFKTLQSFDFVKDQFYYQFDFRAYYHGGSGFSIEKRAFIAKVCLITADGVKHDVAKWEKPLGEASAVSYSMIDDKWGNISVSKIWNGEFISVYYIPNLQAITDGVKGIYFHMISDPILADAYYTKDIDLSSAISTSKPMPELSIEWGDDGRLSFKATGVPDKRSNRKVLSQGYYVELFYYDNYNQSARYDYSTGSQNVTLSNEKDGKMDLAFSYWPLTKSEAYAKYAYTMPVYVKYNGDVSLYNMKKDGIEIGPFFNTLEQPRVEVLIEPFTRPIDLTVDFDRWGKKNTVKWQRQKKAKGYDGTKEVEVNCRYKEGKWHVLRYLKGQDPSTYKEVGTPLAGDATKLEVIDQDFDYDKEYVYRVVYLPTILESKFGSKMTQLPGHSNSTKATAYDLWNEVEKSTELGLHIKLTQDVTDTEKVKLKWQYSIPVSGMTWYVEYKDPTEKTWHESSETYSVDPDLTEASASFSGSVCEPVTYRIKTKVGDTFVYSDTLTARLSTGSYIKNVKATTGTHEQTVDVTWDVENADPTNEIIYVVKRRPIGTEEWTLVSDSIPSKERSQKWTDTRPQTGTYYEYTVEAYGAKCAEQVEKAKMDGIVTPGFSQARGTITGHIAFGSGTAVQGVRVSLVKSSADQESDQVQYLSRYIEGAGKGLQWTADSANYAAVFTGQKPATLQLWAKPSGDGSDQMALATLTNALQLEVKKGSGATYYLSVVDLSSGDPTKYKVTEFPNLTFSDHDFTHISAVYDGAAKWKFYVGTDSLLTDSITVANTNWKAIPAAGTKTLAVGGSNQAVNALYKGHVDDIRLWARALKPAEVESNYTRILGGTEEGLKLYWPLDEGELVRQYAFDIACQDGMYQLNHPEVGPNAVPRKEVPKHLKLYGVTDSEGDYIIKGIPFQQGGTNYKVTPQMGVHEFSPGTRSMFISPTSLTANNIDFEDVSSFPMQGYVYYVGTNIPVEGAVLYVDGQPQSAYGEVVKTDDKGHYEMSVPIGDHYVEVKLDHHTMVAGGRFPKTDKTHKFNDAVRYDFADSTLVNFVGRVGGGEHCDTLGVGFGNNERIVGGPSKNNIGVATIALKLNSDKASFNCKTGTSETYPTFRTWESDTTSINSHSFTGTDTDSKYKDKLIYIQTDSVTGEFSALLPPLKYTVQNIKIGSNDQIEFTELPEIDLTSAKELRNDSVLMVKEGSADTTWVKYSYVAKMVKTYFAPPQLIVTQKGSKGFGEQEMKDYAVSSTEKMDIEGIWTEEADGSIKYTYDFPVFAREKEYKFDLHGYELYTNYDTGKAVNDTIALNGQLVTVTNEMSNKQDVVARVIDPKQTGLKDGDIYQPKSNQLLLDKEGRNTVTFTTGFPNVTAPYTRRFITSYERKKRTYSGPLLDGIVLGELANGDNFVTDGPEHVDMVLRDPPGAKGKTTLKKGQTWTKIEKRTDGFYSKESGLVDIIWGSGVVTSTGVGVEIVSSSHATTTMVAGVTGNYSYTNTRENTYVYTEASNISTSTGSKYVGAMGDVFIGKSHNYIIGTCRKLGFHREASGIVLGLKQAVSIDDEIATDFAFTAREIEETMIPKLIDTRKGLLEYTDSLTAVNYENTTDKDVYLTWLKPTDQRYGQEGTYEWKKKPGGKSQDMVLFYGQSIDRWKARLRENEKDKLDAFQDPKYKKENRSFDGGSSYSYSERRDTTHTVTDTHSGSVGVVFEVKHALRANITTLDFGTNWTLKTENGYSGSQVTGDSLDNRKSYVEFDYELNDGNPGTDFTVDIYKSPRGWSDIFLLRGGQSYNPYEGEELARFYEPEKKHVISYGTEKMEQPVIRISTDGKIGASSATLNDVPAGGTGEFILHLTNGTTTNSKAKFTYELDVAETYNPNGLEVLMDGVPAKGRGIYIPAGETVTKTITVRQTDQSILDYEGIRLWFCSQYQPFSIYDECKLNVHFVPSSSPVELAITEPVVNCSTDSAKLEMKVKGFNRQFKNLKNVGVQYRFAGNTQWTNLYTWWVNPEDTTGLSKESNKALPATGDLKLKVKMLNDLSYPEGMYEFRAFTTTPYGSENVHVYSDVVNVVKDRTRPINLYTPAPANGILGYGDQMAIEFNEDIVPGYVGADNVIVTAKLNQEEVKHDVSLALHPFGDQPKTVNPVFMNGDFSVEFWLKWTDSGTILHQGPKTDNFAIGINSEGRATVTIAQKEFVSTAPPLPKNEWTFFALNYKQATMTFNVMASYGTTDVMLFANQKVPYENVQAVNYNSDNSLYLGEIDGNIHSLALYNIWRNLDEASSEKFVRKDNYVYGLANYWPMDEGHGFTAADSRHTHDFSTPERWTLENENYSLRITDRKGAEADISQIGTSRGESYAIELWYSRSVDEDEVVFETATPTVEGDQLKTKLKLHYNDSRDLVLDYGTKSQMVASHENFDFTSWHHYALNVVRGQAASFYLDGQRTAVIPEADMVNFEGSRLIVGNKATWAMADEIRIWKAALSESRLLQNMYNTIDTASIYSRGLVAYYPFEKRHEENNHVSKEKTLDNMAPGAVAKEMICKDFAETDLVKAAPPLKNAPDEQPLIVTPVASERKVVINLTGIDLTPRRLEGTTLNITVDKIHDLHGNESQPIKWTAYVRQNTLMWAKDSVNIFKRYGDDYTFDVDIENKSGSTELYTLYNMPQWLTLVDSERTDDVSPLKTKTLRFEVNPLVPVGNYDLNIGLQGNNGILEPLRIVMKVRGEKPQWAVDPTKYDHNMSIIGQVYIGGILMENPESMVAAFIGGECRGVASPEKVRGAAYVTMNVYGIDDKRYDMGKEVSFRIWDASKGVAYTDANIAVTVKTAAQKDSTMTTVIFGQDKMLGTFDAPAIWTKSENVEQLIPIHQNWNWIAFGVEPQSTYLDHVFGAYAEWSMLLKSRDNWNDYNGAQWGGGTLTRAKANEMYKLKIDRLPITKQEEPNSLLAVSGRQLKENKERAVTLAKGWNWIAYTPLTTMTVDEALAAANPQKGDIVKSQTGVAIYGEYGWEGSLKALESGHGYLYYSNANDTTSFLYPTERAASAVRAHGAAPRRAPEDLRIFNPVPLGLYPSNMTMAIQLRDGDAVVDTAEVAAFISDECRGATRASSNGLFYLVISGDGAGQTMTLRTCLDGEIIDIDNTQMYVSDANIGTSWEPYVIDLSTALTGIRVLDGSDVENDSDWWTLQGFKIGRKPTQPGVYIHKGKTVTIKRKK